MNFKSKLTTAIATGAVLLNALAPVALANSGLDLTVSGNGADSNNTVNATTTNDTNVTQNNDAVVNNNVTVASNTGGNTASRNTGGDVNVSTGDASTYVAVSNALNSNHATVDTCCVNSGSVTISGNGDDSRNRVDLNLGNSVNVNQNNDARVNNNVSVASNTGHNDASRNTGGDVSIETGDTDTTVVLSTLANVNSAVVGGNGNGGKISAWISGNGADSDNRIDLDLDNDVVLEQDNDARVNNDVDVAANTGNNDANRNTGGEVEIVTGDADATVVVDNMVNLNAADVDACGCLTNLTAKINGNGDDSRNRIVFGSESDLDVEQDNRARLNNDVDVEGNTGDNNADRNTGKVDAASDPSVTTGDTDTNVGVSNEANANILGDFDLDDLFGHLDLDFDFDFDLDWLVASFSAHASK